MASSAPKSQQDMVPTTAPVESPWSRTVEEVLAELEVSPEQGLDQREAAHRLLAYGPNQLREAKRASVWEITVRQFKSLIVGLLVAAAAVSFLFHEYIEGLAIVVVLVINAVLGFVSELRALRSMEALRQLGRVQVRVRRDSELVEIGAETLVPGDIVWLEGGDMIAADLRLVESSKLQVDESILTGESLPVMKRSEPLSVDAPLVDRQNMLFKGTASTRGSATAVVVATGMATALGQIAQLVEEAEEETTPLERRLSELGTRLIGITLAIAALTTIAGILSGKEIFLMVETGIALAVAAIPEGLPIVATMALARGMWRMARRNALINRLSAVETLGATSLVMTDKTGTLTENQMTVRRFALATGSVEVSGEGLSSHGQFSVDGEVVDPQQTPGLREALRVAVLCNNASVRSAAGDDGEWDKRAAGGLPDGGDKLDEGDELTGVGDPLEVALLVAGLKAGIDRTVLAAELPEDQEEAFDSVTKMMATYHRLGGAGVVDGLRGGEAAGYLVVVKGAAEEVLDACTSLLVGDTAQPMSNEEKQGWLRRNEKMARDGLRVLAMAQKKVASLEQRPYESLTFVALVGLLDPPRKEVRSAIAACRQAGMRVVMVTGDQPATAENIAEAIGLVIEGEGDVLVGRDLGDIEELPAERQHELLGVDIFARVDPKQKLDLIALHQAAGSVVAMTGDGVNDAPALKKADIGVAMGLGGTQVAQEASDMVLTDDSFSSIVAAVQQGRIIFGNIRKFVFYLLSCNVSEIMIIGGAAAAKVPLPILPLQILFLNLVTDVFPALALAMGEGDPKVMEKPPRDAREPLLTRRHWLGIGGFGLLITIAVLAALGLALRALGFDTERAVTVSFLTLAVAQLWHVFNLREIGSTLTRNEIVHNRWIWGALAICALLLLAAIYLPGFSSVLHTVDPGLAGWAVVLAMSLAPTLAGQIWIAIASDRPGAN
jgi:Ca2+-transporting ATPase